MTPAESGVPVYRHRPPERSGFAPPAMLKKSRADALERFIDRNIGTVERVFHEIVSELIHIDIHLVPPRPGRPYHTLVTMGMSALPMTVPRNAGVYKYAELMMSLPDDWKFDEESLQDEKFYWPLRALKFMARFPHDYRTWLGSGHTVPNGDPPAPLHESVGFSGLLALPTVLYPGCRFCRIGLVNPVYFYALVPVFASEMDFKVRHGLGALLDKFVAHGVVEVVDPDRTAAVSGPNR